MTSANPEQRSVRPRIVFSAGSVNNLLPIPGVTENAHGFREIPEALYLRDHITRQIELAEQADDPAERAARCTFVVVGAGYTGTEVTTTGVWLTTGEDVPTCSLIWCVGVRPNPLVNSLGLPAERGRVVVSEYLSVPGYPEVFACGDAAGVPDLTTPGTLTAQHAQRQGTVAAHNVAASLTGPTKKAYRHHDLGFVVHLGGFQAAANPLGVPLSGLPVKVVTRCYHLAAIPGNRLHTAVDWLMDAVLPRQSVQLGLVRSELPKDG